MGGGGALGVLAAQLGSKCVLSLHVDRPDGVDVGEMGKGDVRMVLDSVQAAAQAAHQAGGVTRGL
jgi:hypothetical protein